SGDSISEGAVIGQIGAADEAPADAGKANGKAAEAAKPAAPQAEAEPQAEPEAEEEAVEETAPSNGAQQATTTTTEDGRIKASPLARRMAEERGIDLAQVTGSGPGGRIVKADIESFKPGAAPAKAAPPSVPLPMPSRTPPPASDDVVHEEISNLRRRIAATTIESQQTIPHFYITTEVDAAPMLALRKQLNDSLPEGGTKITVNDMVVKATALTLRQFPNLNSHYYGD